MNAYDGSPVFPSQSKGEDVCRLGGNFQPKPQLSKEERSALLKEAIALQERQQKILARLVSSGVSHSPTKLAIPSAIEARPDRVSTELQSAIAFDARDREQIDVTDHSPSFQMDNFLGFGMDFDAPLSPLCLPSPPTGYTPTGATSYSSSSSLSFNQDAFAFQPDLFSTNDCFNLFMPSVASPLPYTPASPPPFDMSPAPIPSNKSRVPSQPKRFPCPLQGCPKSFSQRAGLNSHLVTHTGNRQYICEVCSKSYTTNNRLTVHKRTHSGERPYKCSEPGCNYAATQKCTLKNHLQTHLDIARKREIKFLNMRTVPCLTCGKLYKTVESLAHHAKTEH